MNQFHRKWASLWLWSLIVMGVGVSCSSSTQPLPKPIERGQLFEIRDLAFITKEELGNALTQQNILLPDDFELTYDIRLYTMVYGTLNGRGEPVKASALVVVPVKDGPLPLLSHQHDSQLKDKLVPSFGASEGNIMAAMGFAVIAPDYIGYGVSESEVHPYMHAKSLAISVIDALRTRSKIFEALQLTHNGQIFLMGYSEGAYATMATQQEIEKNYAQEIPLTAVSVGAGPFDMVSSTLAVVYAKNHPIPAEVPFFALAYDYIYGWDRPLDYYFLPPFPEIIPKLIGGQYTFEEANKAFPATPSLFLRQEFLDAIVNQDPPEFAAAYAENDTYHYKPQAPLRMFHGEFDEAVPFFNAQNAIDHFTNDYDPPAPAELVVCKLLENGAHQACRIPYLIDAYQWLSAQVK